MVRCHGGGQGPSDLTPCLLPGRFPVFHQPLRNNPALVTLYRDVVMPGETYPDAEVEEQAVKCLGLCCLLDKVRCPAQS